MKHFNFLAMFFLLSCSNEIELGHKSGILFLKDVKIGAGDLHNEAWDIGKEREVEISKGFKFDVDVPELSNVASQALLKKHGIDSWLYKVTKITRGSRRELGMVAIDSRNGGKVTKTFTIHVYYHAASVSRDFRRFHCPAFGHRKKIEELEMGRYEPKRDEVYARLGEYVRGEVDKLSFAPLIFPGGKSLEGKYLIEVALYNSQEKRTYSSWTPLRAYPVVKREVDRRVKSCMGVKEEDKPLPNSRPLRIQDLQIR